MLKLLSSTLLRFISSRLTLRVTLGIVCVLGLLSAVFVWRAMNGPVSLGIFTPRLEAMINSGLKGIQLKFDDSIIEWSEGKKLAHLQFLGVSIVDENEGVIARVPKANVTLSGPALLGGTVAPTNVELIGVTANVVRRSGGGFQLGLQVSQAKPAEPEQGGSDSQAVIKTVLQAMLQPKADDTLSRYLKRFSISDAKLSVFDEDSKSYWRADKASLTFDRKTDGVVVTINAPVTLANKSVWKFTAAGKYTNGSQNIALEVAFRPVRLSVLAASGSGLQFLKGFDVPVQGNAACNMTISGQIGLCRFWLNAGTGELQLPALKKEPIHFKEAALTVQIDVPSRKYSIEELTWQGNTIRGKVSGDGAFSFGDNGEIRTLSADWTAENIFIDAPNLFDGGLALETAKFKGSFDADAKTLTIERILARRGPFELNLAGALVDNAVSMGVVLAGNLKDLSVPDLKRLWPAGAVVGARDWIFANMHEGVIKSGDIAINIAPGAIVGDKIPDEMMNISLQMTGLRVTYLNGLPDLTNVSGHAVVNGDTFKAEMTSGAVGNIGLKHGNVLINELSKQGTIGQVSGTMAGPTRDIMMLLDLPRLKYPSRYGIQADKAGGTAEVNFNFAIPMLKDLDAKDMGIDVDAQLRDVKLPINDKFGLTGGKFSVKLDVKGLKALGAVQINGASVGFIWNEDFTGTAKFGTHIDITATLTESQRDIFGLNAAPYLDGRTAIVATFTGNHGNVQNATIDANLTGSRLSIPELNWAKPEDANASLKATLAIKPGNVIEISNIDATGREMKAQGRLVIADGVVREADFKKVELGKRNDFAFTYVAAPDLTASLEIRGKALDAGGFFSGSDATDEKPSKPEAKHALSVKADLTTAHLQGGVSLTNAKLAYTDDGLHLTQFKLDATDQNSRIRGELTTSGDGSRKLRFDAADAGRVVKGVTGFHSLIGGDLKLTADLTPLSQGVKTEAAFDGKLTIENFKIVDQPFFARLLSAGSFTGLDDLMRGEGITFSKLEQTVHGRGSVLTFSDGRAAGPSIGLTMQGTYQRDTEKLDLNGTIVPLYGLNSIFEDIPLVSDILGSKDGEGIFAVTYGIRGEVNELRVAVNPISMLTPGFLRKIFQVGSKPQTATPMPLPMPKADQKPPQPAIKPN
ncbi:MAG: AsmA-like C-terminal region-containing protein [Micropepsaceae bacterium]